MSTETPAGAREAITRLILQVFRLNGRLLGNLDGHGLDPTRGQGHDGQTDWPHSGLRSDRPHALLS